VTEVAAAPPVQPTTAPVTVVQPTATPVTQVLAVGPTALPAAGGLPFGAVMLAELIGLAMIGLGWMLRR
jgi:hypothetical protein